MSVAYRDNGTAARYAHRGRPVTYRARAGHPLERRARTVVHGALAVALLAWMAIWFLVMQNAGRRILEIGLALAVICLLLTPRAQHSLSGAADTGRPSTFVAPVPRVHHPASTHHAASSISATLSRVPGEQTAGATCPPTGICDDSRRRAERPNPAGRLLAPPSVSAGAILRALSASGSPLAATSQRRDGKTYAEYIWDEGKASGIDPAVVMAIFRFESHYGTLGMARLTHSLGNIRPVGLQPEICSGDGCYAYANDWFDGVDRIYGLLREYARQGAATVDQVIPIWAPPSDNNDDAAYVAGVRETMQALHLDS
jgi:hypothetical protein